MLTQNFTPPRFFIINYISSCNVTPINTLQYWQLPVKTGEELQSLV